MKHYETLGVEASATPDEIKRAYRRKSSQWHPDRHPDNLTEATTQMQQINRAYAVLSDPALRERYDAGEEDVDTMEADAVEQEAVDRLLALFGAYLDNASSTDNCIDTILKGMALSRDKAQQTISDCTSRIDSLESRRRHVRHKKAGGVDMYTAVINRKVEQLREDIADRERHLRVIARIIELASEYEGVPDKKPPPRHPGSSPLVTEYGLLSELDAYLRRTRTKR